METIQDKDGGTQPSVKRMTGETGNNLREGQIVVITDKGRTRYMKEDLDFIIKIGDVSAEVCDQEGDIKYVKIDNITLIKNWWTKDPIGSWLPIHHSGEE